MNNSKHKVGIEVPSVEKLKNFPPIFRELDIFRLHLSKSYNSINVYV